MMFKWKHMSGAVKALFIVFMALFVLTGCNNGNSAEDTRATTAEDTSQKATEVQQKCWQDGVLIVIYDTLGTSALSIYKQMTSGALPLMMIAFAIWFSLRMLAHVGSVTEENIGEVWKEVLTQFFLCFVCGLIASSADMMLYILNIVVFPIYTAFLEFGAYIMQTNGSTSTGGYSAFGSEVKFDTPFLCKVEGTSIATFKDGFPSAPKNIMACMVCSVNQRLVIGMDYAFAALSGVSWIGWLVGAVVYVLFLFVRIGFVFYLVDTVFRFAIMLIILPILVMGYAFKATRGWTSQGFLTIINSAAYMCAIAIILTITMLAMEELFSSQSKFFNGQEAFYDDAGGFSVMFLSLMLICFLLMQSINVAKEVADSLVGGGGSANFKNKVKFVFDKVKDLVLALLTFGTGTAIQGTVKGARKAQELIKKAAEKVKSKKN
ncbi:MAG: hypothetical protein PHE89_02405 [Alphaproteobacteria bacterium]|nr:hypothetical protein [Alphaproteobacteria bacterium]